MRRMLIAAVATTALTLPGVALAHGGDRQRGEDHHGVQQGELHHARHHRHARLIAFRAHAPTTTAPGQAGASPSPTPVTSERAGTIASFTGGTLTITLDDGTAVSGKVTPRTEIECRAGSATAADDNGDGGRGDANSSGPGPSGQSGGSGRDGRDGDADHNDADHNDLGANDVGDNDAGDDDAHDEAEHCMPAALVPGASVREALLSVGSAGAFWVKLEL
jgi:hypothetical protein